MTERIRLTADDASEEIFYPAYDWENLPDSQFLLWLWKRDRRTAWKAVDSVRRRRAQEEYGRQRNEKE